MRISDSAESILSLALAPWCEFCTHACYIFAHVKQQSESFASSRKSSPLYLVLHLLMSVVVGSEAKREMIGGVKDVLARAQGWYFKAMDDPGRR